MDIKTEAVLAALAILLTILNMVSTRISGAERNAAAAKEKRMDERLEDLERDVASTRGQQQAFQGEVLTDFVRRSEFSASIDRVFAKLDRIDARLDAALQRNA